MGVNPVRAALLACADTSIQLIRTPRLRERWDTPSVLEHWSVSGLAGHLVRAFTTIEEYLDAPEPTGESIGPAAYYAAALDNSDLQSDLHNTIRRRGDEMAAQGLDSLIAHQEGLTARLRSRLAEEPPDRKVGVFKGLVLSLDDYLITRIVELCTHIDDLAISVGEPTPDMPPEALDLAISALVGLGRHRHGDLAVLRALVRRERDDVNALRVL